MKDYLKALKKLIFIFFAAEVIKRVAAKVKKPEKSTTKNTAEKAAVNTDRLTITPMSENELEALMEETRKTDSELADAYGDMLEGCRKNPGQFLWYTAWKISSRETDEMLGDICFKGLPENGQPEIGYGIIEKFRCCGYATEAVEAMCSWAESQSAVNAIEAEAVEDNTPSLRVLEKCGFVKTGEYGEEGARFIRKKAQP